MDTLKRNPVDILDKASLAAMNFNVVKRIDSQTEEVGKSRPQPHKGILEEDTKGSTNLYFFLL